VHTNRPDPSPPYSVMLLLYHLGARDWSRKDLRPGRRGVRRARYAFPYEGLPI